MDPGVIHIISEIGGCVVGRPPNKEKTTASLRNYASWQGMEPLELLEAVCERFRAGEGVACRFFRMDNSYLFIGDYKYWLMTHWDALKPGEDYVLNRARLYRDRRDFVIQRGDTGKPENYPVTPAHQS